MKKNYNFPYKVPNNYYSSYFGILFQRIKYKSLSAFCISTIYKILSTVLYLFIYLQRKFLKIPIHGVQKKIYQALHAGHTYGMFYYHKSDREWIDMVCEEKNISPTDKIILGFGGAFHVKKRGFSLKGTLWFEKSVFICLSSLILIHSLILILYSCLIILTNSSIQTTLRLTLFWVIYILICFFYTQIMKGSFWDANNLFQKYR